MSIKNILFITDGSKKIGFGHIKRCLYLSKVFKDYKIYFYINKDSEPILNDYIKFSTRSDFNKLDINHISSITKKINPDIIIISSELISNENINKIKRFCKFLVLIDDINYFDGDLVVNPNNFADGLKYKSFSLTGTKYVLIKPEFKKYHKKYKKIHKEVNKILVTMGTTDPLNLTEIIVKSIEKLNMKITVIVGPGSTNNLKTDKNVEIIKDSNNMEKLLYDADIAITAGGLTIYESAAVGTPTIVLCESENQIANANSMNNKSLINLGYGKFVSSEQIKNCVTSLIQNQDKRIKLSKIGKFTVDCKGPERVENYIKNHMNTLPVLVPATKKDCKDLWLWRNDPETRLNSFSSEIIDYETHENWFSNILEDKKVHIFIAKHKNKKIGMVRFDKEIHININPKFRNMGYGKRVLRVSIPIAFNQLKTNKILARIKSENKKSINMFLSTGFKIISFNIPPTKVGGLHKRLISFSSLSSSDNVKGFQDEIKIKNKTYKEFTFELDRS